MPKLMKYEEEDEEESEEDDEEFEAEEEEESMKAAQAKKSNVKKRGRPVGWRKETEKVNIKKPSDSPLQDAYTPGKKLQQRRYSAIIQQPYEGIVDSETRELIATSVWDALADILERLERIENSIGSIMNT